MQYLASCNNQWLLTPFVPRRASSYAPGSCTKGLQTNANKSSIPLSLDHSIYLWSFYCPDNIFHKTNTSCYLAKEEATLKVIKLIVVKSVVRVSLTLFPQAIQWETTGLGHPLHNLGCSETQSSEHGGREKCRGRTWNHSGSNGGVWKSRGKRKISMRQKSEIKGGMPGK